MPAQPKQLVHRLIGQLFAKFRASQGAADQYLKSFPRFQARDSTWRQQLAMQYMKVAVDHRALS